MKTRIKICGLTCLEDARFCAAAGADYLGFILADSSPRQITPELAREIVSWVYGPLTVGVFRDAEVDFVNRVAEQVGFDLVQLHGNESPEYCREMDAPVIKAIPVGPQTTREDLLREMDRFDDFVQHLLLDTAVGGSSGGTGIPFDWQLASDAVDSARTIVAGGISPLNVVDAIDQLHPFAVDVSSGVEKSPGIKSFDKISALFDAVNQEHT
jgi:phosphoribosylanthranilate isomerase